jgi:hypothetical protein
MLCFRRAALWLGPYPHTAEFFNEGFGVRVICKAEPRVLHDFEHTPSSIRRLIVSPGVAEFVHFANAIGGGELDRDLVGKIAINLLLGDLTFASDHRRQTGESKNPANEPLARDPLYQHDTTGFPDSFACRSPE